jgi:hypothetical protein
MHKLNELVSEKEIVTPEGGWKAHTYYVVQVAYTPTNPVHTAILGVGFLQDNGSPGNYSEIWCTSYEFPQPFKSAWYLEVVKVIGKIKD